MKKLLHLTCFLLALVLLYVYLTKPRESPSYLSSNQQISPNTIVTDHEFVDVLRAMNARTAKIQTVVCQDMDIKIKAQMLARLDASLAFERHTKFRMGVKSITGKEMDIGSNETHFWFWSKRMNPPALHYAKHEDIQKTMLKTPLNPMWLLECLGISQIKTEDVQIAQVGKYWAVIEERMSNFRPVTKITLIDRENQRIVGHYLYDHRGKMEASAEVVSYQALGGQHLPHTMVIIWYSEGIQMEWTLNNPQINVELKDSYWNMPAMSQTIDMARN